MDPSYKRLKDSRRVRIDQKYRIAGFISSGTYGKVYKAVHIESGKEVAIKKFKPEKDFDPSTSAFSQSACREIAVGPRDAGLEVCADARRPEALSGTQT